MKTSIAHNNNVSLSKGILISAYIHNSAAYVLLDGNRGYILRAENQEEEERIAAFVDQLQIGAYVFADLTDSGNSLSTMNLPLEDFYAGARDADFLIYNSTIEGVVSTTDELVAKCSLLTDFKAVQNGHVWCVAQSFFQQSMELADFILELHRLFTEDAPDGLQYFIHIE